ncbi:MAG: aldo/keto reductase [Sphingomonas bacterium]|nr:aldo/keto reductase [Sphingomonas bacterium]
MTKRAIGPLQTRAIGLGCMSLSHAYGAPPPAAEAARLLHRALDLGYDFLDTAALYGFGANETLLGETLKARRGDYVLASKCGMTGVNGTRVIDGRPETLRATIDESLKRLQVEVIDLYYLHRYDRQVPIEDSVGALAEMVRAGKVRAIGLSEVSAETLRRAHAEHPIAAVQNEYSPWSRNVEIGVLAATRELGAALVAFSPVARGFLADAIHDHAALGERDIRRGMPRFQPGNIEANLGLLARFKEIAQDAGCTPAQLSLAWVITRGDHVVAIPGTTRLDHLEENIGALAVSLDEAVIARIDALFTPGAPHGARYPAATQAEIDTEEFA